MGKERFAAGDADVLGDGGVVLFMAGSAGEVREVHQKTDKLGARRAAMAVLKIKIQQEKNLRISSASQSRSFYLLRRGGTGPGDSFRYSGGGSG